MRRRLIILTTMLSIVLCIALFGYSVYASLNQSFSISNTIGFTPSQNVYVDLECRVSGIKQMQLEEVPEGYQSFEEYYLDKGFIHYETHSSEDKLINKPQVLNNWEIPESLVFVNEQTPIVYTIKVYNYSDMAITVRVAEYETNSEFFVNEPSSMVTIDGYVEGQEAKYATITLTTTVAKNAQGFSEKPNNFKIVMETYNAW